jgi:hypothetical protein
LYHFGGVYRLFTIIVDNASPNDVVIDYIRTKIKEKDCAVLGGKLLYMWCVAHILNFIVSSKMKGINIP